MPERPLAEERGAAAARRHRRRRHGAVERALADARDDIVAGADLVARVRQCALDSAAATATMAASRGRASFLGERALGHVDPGSRSMALIIAAICDSL